MTREYGGKDTWYALWRREDTGWGKISESVEGLRAKGHSKGERAARLILTLGTGAVERPEGSQQAKAGLPYVRCGCAGRGQLLD